MIGLKAAEEAGVELSHDTWDNVWSKAAEGFLTNCQNPDGGFAYQPVDAPGSGGSSNGRMTAAGIWCLRLSGVPVEDERIQAGLAWLDCYPYYGRRIQPENYHYYFLWGAAKALTVCDRLPVLEEGNWYRDFSGYLLASQNESGQWVNPVWPEGESHLNATQYALLVLEKAVLPPPPGLAFIDIDHMRIEFDTRPNRDKIKILQARFQLEEGASYDLAQDVVTVNVDGVIITIPAGSFTKKGQKESYHFDSAGGVEPRIHMELDFEKGEWKLMVHDVDASVVASCDGVNVTLMIGYMLAGQNVDMWIDYLVYPPHP